MRRFLFASLFSLFIFLFTAYGSYAQDLSLDDCIVGKQSYGNCGGFIEHVRSCLADGENGQKVSSTAFNPDTNDDTKYPCNDFDGNGFDSADIDKCKVNFSIYVCRAADPYWLGGPGHCSGAELFGNNQLSGTASCGATYDGAPYLNAFQRIFETNYTNATTIPGVVTPTPTQMPVPTGNERTISFCLKQIYYRNYSETNSCDTSLNEVKNCLKNVPPGDISAAYGDNYKSLEQDVIDAYNADTDTKKCMSESFISTMPDTLGNLFTEAQQEETAEQNSAGSSELIEGDLPDYEALLGTEGPLDCGTLNASCCKNPTDVDLPENINFRMPASADSANSEPGILSRVFNNIFRPFKPLVTLFLNLAKDTTNIYIANDAKYYCNEGITDKEFEKVDGALVATSCKCINGSEMLLQMCNNIDISKDTTEFEFCRDCVKTGYWTSLGCIDSDVQTFIQKTVFGWGLGLAGVTALLCVIYSSFRMQLSANNPEQIKGAQELLTSCITGLIVIIFSVVILRIIGVDILRIPGLQ